MATSLDELLEAVYQHFLDLYQQSDETPAKDIFLAFEPIGRIVDIDSYKLTSASQTFSSAKATEELTELTDDIPLINADMFHRTDKSIEEMYGTFILQGATPGTADQGEINLFNHVKAASQQKFEDMKLGKLGQHGVQYRPAYADPQDWYDPGQADNWTRYTYKMESQQSSSSGKPPKRPAKKTPNVVLRPQISRWQWHVLPKDLLPVLTRPQLMKQVSVSPQVLKQVSTVRPQQAATVEPKSFQRQSGRLQQPVVRSQPANISTAFNRTHSERLVSKAVLSEVAAHQLSINATTGLRVQQQVAQPVLAPAVLDSIRQQIKQPQMVETNASEALQASVAAALLDSSYSKTVVSKQLTVSFEYCIVQVDRPWLSMSLLHTKGWYIPGYAAGEFSNGTVSNSGLFPALPIAFILVRELEISGWSNAEYEHVKDSIALGPFSLLDRKLSKTSLTWSGMQVIGWISQVMPLMPPLSAPNVD